MPGDDALFVPVSDWFFFVHPIHQLSVNVDGDVIVLFFAGVYDVILKIYVYDHDYVSYLKVMIIMAGN